MAGVGARSASAAMEIIQLDNGGMAKSINGNYRREYNAEYRFIAENGTIETDIYNFGDIRIYKADKQICDYRPSILKNAPFAPENAGQTAKRAWAFAGQGRK
jgi:hypothetical protein